MKSQGMTAEKQSRLLGDALSSSQCNHGGVHSSAGESWSRLGAAMPCAAGKGFSPEYHPYCFWD